MKNNMMLNMPFANMGFQNNNMMMNNNIFQNMDNMKNEMNLIFVYESIKHSISISPEKTVMEAINLYKNKFGNNSKDLIFFYNGKKLYPRLKIGEAGLIERSEIIVVNAHKLVGG